MLKTEAAKATFVKQYARLRMKFNFLVVFIALQLYAIGQEITLNFQPGIEGEVLVLNNSYRLTKLNEDIQINTFRFYIGNLSFYKKGILMYSLPNNYYLIDGENQLQLKIKTEKLILFDEVRFQLGVDSFMNSKGVFPGDLDPMNGMYWTWQSGYINLKLEGSCPACGTPKNEFLFHIGGYTFPNGTTREIILKTKLPGKSMTVGVELSKVLDEMLKKQSCAILSPGVSASSFATIMAASFILVNE